LAGPIVEGPGYASIYQRRDFPTSRGGALDMFEPVVWVLLDLRVYTSTQKNNAKEGGINGPAKEIQTGEGCIKYD
jgi:hypothetical protein